MDVAGQHQGQPKRVLGDRMRRVPGNPDHGQVRRTGRFEVHVVEAGTPEHDRPQPRRCQHADDLGIDDVVDEYADRVVARGEWSGVGPKGKVEPGEVVALVSIRRGQELAVVRS